MKVLFRADSNKVIAMGHVMRCLSIADALKEEKNEVLFLTASDDPVELITRRGFDVKVLNTDFEHPADEFTVSKPLIEAFDPDITVVDSYYVTDAFFEKLNTLSKTCYIDDYGKEAFPVDVLVNYNIYGPTVPYIALYAKKGLALPKLCLGTEYTPLRRAFRDAKPIKIKEKGEFKVLLSTGGSDALSMAKDIADKFLLTRLKDVSLNILVGPFSKDRDYLFKLEKENPHRIKIRENITDMPGFLSEFDLALSAAGSTSYEICRMGVPAMLFGIADNQNMINKTFDTLDIIKSAGSAESERERVIGNLIAFIKEAKENYQYRVSASEKERKTVDGKGAMRIAGVLNGITIKN